MTVIVGESTHLRGIEIDDDASPSDGQGLYYDNAGAEWKFGIPTHTHASAAQGGYVTFGTEPPSVALSTSGTAGVANSPSRSDHCHDLGTHTHADPTTGGTISHTALTDKGTSSTHAKLDMMIDYCFNVRHYGAVGDNSTDDTAAIRSAIQATATSRCKTVYFPPGNYKITDAIEIGSYGGTTLNGLRLVGDSPRNTLITFHHATKNLFEITTAAPERLTWERMTVQGGVTRTAGWALYCTEGLGFSHIDHIEITAMFNGIYIDHYWNVWIRDFVYMNPYTGAEYAIYAGASDTSTGETRGGNLFIEDSQITGYWPPADFRLGCGICVENADAIYIENSGTGGTYGYGILIRSNGTNPHAPLGVVMNNICADSPQTAAACRVVGAYYVAITNSAFQSAGQDGTGVPVTADMSNLELVDCVSCAVSGTLFNNNTGVGLYSDNSWGAISGCTFFQCGTYGISINQDTLNDMSWAITGCAEKDSGLGGIITDAESNRLRTVGNFWESGVVYGVDHTDLDTNSDQHMTLGSYSGNVSVDGSIVASAVCLGTRWQVNKTADTLTFTALECSNTFITNYGQLGEATWTLPAAAAGLCFTLTVVTTDYNLHIKAGTGDKIYLDGVALDDGDKVTSDTDAGDSIRFWAFQTGTSTYDWFAETISGTWVDGGA